MTSRPLPEGTPDNVSTAPSAGELIDRIRASGITGDVHLVGGPKTMQAFRDIDALAELGVVVIPLIQGSGLPMAPAGIEPMSLRLESTRTFPDGVIESWYVPVAAPSVQRRAAVTGGLTVSLRVIGMRAGSGEVVLTPPPRR